MRLSKIVNREKRNNKHNSITLEQLPNGGFYCKMFLKDGSQKATKCKELIIDLFVPSKCWTVVSLGAKRGQFLHSFKFCNLPNFHINIYLFNRP